MKTRAVYVVGWDDAGPVKIGVTANLSKRLESLQVGNPYDLRVIHHEPLRTGDAGMVEYLSHQALKEHRLRGEWFALSAREAFATVAEIAKRFERRLPLRDSLRVSVPTERERQH